MTLLKLLTVVLLELSRLVLDKTDAERRAAEMEKELAFRKAEDEARKMMAEEKKLYEFYYDICSRCSVYYLFGTVHVCQPTTTIDDKITPEFVPYTPPYQPYVTPPTVAPYPFLRVQPTCIASGAIDPEHLPKVTSCLYHH